MLTGLATALAFAALNRARGSRFWGLLGSTQLSRLAATAGMASIVTAVGGDPRLLLAWPLLMLWALPGWGVYQSAATGNPTNFMEREFPPVDWIMARIPFFAPVYLAAGTDLERRLWGTVAMALRQSLAAPAVAAVAHLAGNPWWWAATTPLLAAPYLIAGYAARRHHVMYAEYGAGAILGLLCHRAAL